VIRHHGRTAGVLCAGLLVLALAACSPPDGASHPPGGPGTAAPPSATSTPGTSPVTPTTTPPTNDPEAALRTRLADALRAEDPISAGFVANSTTGLDAVPTAWLPGWQVVDVNVLSMPHPRRFFVGLSEAGRARDLSGHPEAFDAMVTDARIRVGQARTAVAVGQAFLDTTRTFQRYSTRVEDLRRVGWVTDLSPAEQGARDRVLQAYDDQVGPPRAAPAGDGWTLTAWTVDGPTLVRHDLTVAATGTVTDRPEVVARDLPVPESV